MTLDDLWADVRELTGKLSEVARQAAYAGFAVIWIFKTGTETSYHLDRSLILAGALLALALCCDLAQYAVSVLLRWRHARLEERRRGVNYAGDDLTFPLRQNRVPYALFALKVALVAVGYAILIVHLVRALQS
jgi:hypothetical protein